MSDKSTSNDRAKAHAALDPPTSCVQKECAQASNNGDEFADVIIVGGGFSGLAAATILSRYPLSVIIIDKSGCDGTQTRNSHAAISHGVFGFPHHTPQQIIQQVLIPVKANRNIRIVKDTVTEIIEPRQSKENEIKSKSGTDRDLLQICTASKGRMSCSRLIVAVGIEDILPDCIPKFYQYYGKSIHHCLVCDGNEYIDKPVVVIGKPEVARLIDLATELCVWTKDITILVDFEQSISTCHVQQSSQCTGDSSTQSLSTTELENKKQSFLSSLSSKQRKVLSRFPSIKLLFHSKIVSLNGEDSNGELKSVTISTLAYETAPHQQNQISQSDLSAKSKPESRSKEKTDQIDEQLMEIPCSAVFFNYGRLQNSKIGISTKQLRNLGCKFNERGDVLCDEFGKICGDEFDVEDGEVGLQENRKKQIDKRISFAGNMTCDWPMLINVSIGQASKIAFKIGQELCEEKIDKLLCEGETNCKSAEE
ncbi:hypothetical protein BKA69DRAFT_1058028 [Paraphysoderma sedebokerense]|nr:hypothetical protein BKA69DRAFT_1058028 [Paraphysoderma sedebokerense]